MKLSTCCTTVFIISNWTYLSKSLFYNNSSPTVSFLFRPKLTKHYNILLTEIYRPFKATTRIFDDFFHPFLSFPPCGTFEAGKKRSNRSNVTRVRAVSRVSMSKNTYQIAKDSYVHYFIDPRICRIKKRWV